MKPADPLRPSDAEAIEATAAAWLAQRDDGFSPAQAAEFAAWRAADGRHNAAVARLEAAWAELQRLREFRPEAVRHPDRDLLREAAGRRRMSPFRAVAKPLALAAALVLAAGWWWGGMARQTDATAQRHATTVDGYERLTLADGSVIELNSASEVRVQFSATERRVRLVRGEAHFTVAKNPSRPFWVEAGSVAVRAVGTAFNVRLGGSDVVVLVTEGRVAVAGATSGPGTPSVGSPGGSGAAELGANERIVIAFDEHRSAPTPREAPVIERIAPAAVREALAWQGPRLLFVETPLAEAIAQFNRRNPVQIELADAELAGLPIGGSFRAENVDAFVRLLESGGDVAVERPDATHVILRRMK